MFSHRTQSLLSRGKILFDPPILPNLIPMWTRSLLILCSVLHTCMLDRGVAYIMFCRETGLKIHDTQEYNICFLSITDHIFWCHTVNITLYHSNISNRNVTFYDIKDHCYILLYPILLMRFILLHNVSLIPCLQNSNSVSLFTLYFHFFPFLICNSYVSLRHACVTSFSLSILLLPISPSSSFYPPPFPSHLLHFSPNVLFL